MSTKAQENTVPCFLWCSESWKVFFFVKQSSPFPLFSPQAGAINTVTVTGLVNEVNEVLLRPTADNNNQEQRQRNQYSSLDWCRRSLTWLLCEKRAGISKRDGVFVMVMTVRSGWMDALMMLTMFGSSRAERVLQANTAYNSMSWPQCMEQK